MQGKHRHSDLKSLFSQYETTVMKEIQKVNQITTIKPLFTRKHRKIRKECLD